MVRMAYCLSHCQEYKMEGEIVDRIAAIFDSRKTNS